MNELLGPQLRWICVCIFNKMRDRKDFSKNKCDVGAFLSHGYCSQSAAGKVGHAGQQVAWMIEATGSAPRLAGENSMAPTGENATV